MRLFETFGLYGLCGVVVLLVTWPTAGSGRRFLWRWGGAGAPSDEQVALVVRRLRERRLLALSLMALAPLTGGVAVEAALTGHSGAGHGLFRLFGALLMSLLLADVLASLRLPHGSTRTATLLPRRWQDLVPRWAVGLHAGLTVLAVGLAVVGLVVQPWVDEVLGRRQGGLDPWRRAELAEPIGWNVIAFALVGLLAVYAVVWLAVVRRAGMGELVDAALRVGGARAAVGIGIWLAAFLDAAALSRLLTIVKQSPEPAPGWLQAVVPTTPWFGVMSLAVAALGWSAVMAAPRRREAGVSA